ncbi:hypothetical protein L1285_02080 [Pseudoalteromonas sp. DL2-H2.2]|uniref:hypothetical protein n=1 Tax=Pseudoalteromonas sp. DL2-H2.2 TaxID=2908889 RepID=UPI001F24EECA|nr:hypothetical protein [Pseudoalteromonas sp. DL2-H2.2]MCF2907133.1 hypothetical protein [Pseudoalteromonas sp. DL2-H2.2]
MSDDNQGTQINDTHIVSTRHANKMKTLISEVEYKSDSLHSYLVKNKVRILNAFERLAAIFRKAKECRVAYDKIRSWHYDVNLLIARTQLDLLQQLRVEKQAGVKLDNSVVLNRPESYKITYEVSHPLGLSITQLIKEVDTEIDEIESLYMRGAIDDIEYTHACKQASVILSGVVDRINKVTARGKRGNISFSPRYYLTLLQDPNFKLLAHCGVPMAIAELILDDTQMAIVRTHHKRPRAGDDTQTASEALRENAE